MITFVEHCKPNCRNAEAFGCDKAKTNCGLCGFFEKKSSKEMNEFLNKSEFTTIWAVSDPSIKTYSNAVTCNNYDFVFKEIKEVKREMEELRKMLGE